VVYKDEKVTVINSSNTLAFVGGGNVGQTSVNTVASPLNKGEMPSLAELLSVVAEARRKYADKIIAARKESE
jgi:hypothetical protein